MLFLNDTFPAAWWLRTPNLRHVDWPHTGNLHPLRFPMGSHKEGLSKSLRKLGWLVPAALIAVLMGHLCACLPSLLAGGALSGKGALTRDLEGLPGVVGVWRPVSQHPIGHTGDDGLHVGLLLGLGVCCECVADIRAQLAWQVDAALVDNSAGGPAAEETLWIRQRWHWLNAHLCRHSQCFQSASLLRGRGVVQE